MIKCNQGDHCGESLAAHPHEPSRQDPTKDAGNNDTAYIPQEEPLDLKRAFEEFDCDREFILNLLEGFLDNARGRIFALWEALSAGDAETVRREAHSIKGGAANLTAGALSSAALLLEEIGRSGELEKGHGLIDRLEREVSRLEEFRTGMAQGHGGERTR
jgi:HPt (histidine-containing phosphotransfer) domain-containing protein